jgi:L-serine deaminase
MKTYKPETAQYKALEGWVEISAEDMAERLATIENAAIQQMAIDTMHRIINSQPEKYAAYSRGTSLAAQIRQEQRSKIEKWGERAYTFSEKQLGVICREIAQLAAIKIQS